MQQLALLIDQKAIVLPPLRSYQEQMRQDVYRVMQENADAPSSERTLLLVLATGGGKTITATRFMVDALMEHGHRSMFIVPLTCLVKQTFETFQRYNVDAGVIAASFGKNPYPDSPIQIASIDTLVNRKIPEDIRLVILDEAHNCGFPPTHRYVWATNPDGTWKHWHPDTWIVGATATPKRTKKTECLGDLYKHMVVGPQFHELMAIGESTEYTEGLCRPIYYAFPKSKQLDLSGVRTKLGDYDDSQLDVAVNNKEVTLNLIQQWEKLCIRNGRLQDARRTLFFGVNLGHSAVVADAVNEYFRERAIAEGFGGTVAKHLSGEAPTEEREYWFGKLSRGEILWLCSVDILSTGFDVPSIECVIPRPTKSWVVNIQQVGRGARCAPWIGKQDFLVLDIGRNAENYKIGRIDDEQEYSLANVEPKKSGEAPMKQCPECDALVYAFHMICPECGYEFEPKEKEVELPSGEMQIVERKVDRKKREDYSRLAVKAYTKNYSPAWAVMRFKEKHGSFPRSECRLHAIFPEATEDNRKDYWRYLKAKAQEKGKDRAWAEQYFYHEFGKPQT